MERRRTGIEDRPQEIFRQRHARYCQEVRMPIYASCSLLTKSLNDCRPKHPLYERLQPTPPLFANGVLFLLSIILSADAFRDYHTIEEVLAARPPPRTKFWIMEWAANVMDDPVFPELSPAGPTKKPKSKSAWGHQCHDWAVRAGFTEGVGLHAPRKEVLIKADGKNLAQACDIAKAKLCNRWRLFAGTGYEVCRTQEPKDSCRSLPGRHE